MQANNFTGFFYRLSQNLAKVFWGKNLLWQAIAIILTFICVISGFDWAYYQFTQISSLRLIIFPAILMGFLLPVLVPAAVIIWGVISKNLRVLNTAFALTQASFLGWLVSAFYKFFTGRPGPENIKALGDITHIFKFGLLRGGIFWGWPSSHTTVAFAMGVCLFTLFPDNKFIKYLALIYALYIGLAVSMTIHWFSDCLAGAIFGSLVGLAVGKSFLYKPKRTEAEVIE